MKGDVPEATAMVMDLRENYGVFCSIVVYPVIPKGHIIYRLIPTAVHTDEDIEATLIAFEAQKRNWISGITRWKLFRIWQKHDSGYLSILKPLTISGL